MTSKTAHRRPVVGVMCCNRNVDGRASQVVANRFLEPLATISQVSAIIVPAIPGALEPAMAAGMLDGLILTGSCSNVSPARYGSDMPETRPDHDRDETMARIAGAMIEAGRPVIGICRGMQEINVLFGGTLETDVGNGISHHARMPQDGCVATLFRHGHDVDVVPDGILHGLLGVRTAAVNSVHHQGVAVLGRGLTAQAFAPDGLVEALHARPRADVVGVQWHPEHDPHINPHGRAFFEAAGRMARGEGAVH